MIEYSQDKERGKRKMEFNNNEKEVLKKILLNAIKNGNTVNLESFIPNGNEYKVIFSIMNKLG